MDKPANLTLLWKLLEDRRGTTESRDLKRVIELAYSNDIALTIEDIRKIALRIGPFECEGICPGLIVDFISDFLSNRNIASILDPWANMGTLLLPISQITKPEKAVGISNNLDKMKIAEKLNHLNNVQFINADPIDVLNSKNGSFELILSCPPFNLPKKKLVISNPDEEIEIADRYENLVIVKSCLRLSKDGTGIFVVLPNFVNTPSFQILETLGFKIKALFSLPAGWFAPVTSIPSALVVIERGRSSEFFVGELSEDRQRNTVLLNNLKNKKEGKELISGKFVSTKTFTDYHSLEVEERIERLAKRTGLSPIPLSEVVKEINLLKSEKSPNFKEQPDTVYLPLIGRSQAITSTTEFTLKPHNYIQLVIDNEKASASYIAGFLNTPLGYSIRELCYSGTVIPKISKSSLVKMRLFLPDVRAQIITIKADLQIKNLVSELQELKEQVWSRTNKLDYTLKQLKRVNNKERFVDWVDTLPFPLASILWTYHAHKDDCRLQHEYLDHFFEALAEFLATLLLSGFINNVNVFSETKEQLKKVLDANHLSIEMSTFGTWVKISEVLSKNAREMINSDKKNICKQMFCVSDEDVLQGLSASKIIGILQETNSLRNEWRGHGGVASDQIVKSRNLILENHLSEVRKYLGDSLTRYQLIKPQNMELEDEVYSIKASRLTGSRTPFEPGTYITKEALDKKYLYMIGEEERTALKLLPLFRVQASPVSAQNACYFYNRKNKDNIRFVTYHFEESAEISETSSSIGKAIDNILGK